MIDFADLFVRLRSITVTDHRSLNRENLMTTEGFSSIDDRTGAMCFSKVTVIAVSKSLPK